LHLVQELGVDPQEKPSARVAAISSFLLFAVGAVIPLLPYLFGVESLWPGLVCGAIGLVIAGAVAARFTAASMWLGAGRQLAFGVVAIAATYLVGKLIGTVV
jgi:VIT1/CCC1 family predicted Fe2+/Mn2+ transporter